jgi:hypothetical protein
MVTVFGRSRTLSDIVFNLLKGDGKNCSFGFKQQSLTHLTTPILFIVKACMLVSCLMPTYFSKHDLVHFLFKLTSWFPSIIILKMLVIDDNRCQLKAKACITQLKGLCELLMPFLTQICQFDLLFTLT